VTVTWVTLEISPGNHRLGEGEAEGIARCGKGENGGEGLPRHALLLRILLKIFDGFQRGSIPAKHYVLRGESRG
jgi:hypothetical protein